MTPALENLIQASEAALQVVRESASSLLAEWLAGAIEQVKQEEAI